MTKKITREEWLNIAVDRLKNLFGDTEIPENVKVSCGFCKGSYGIGLCCSKDNSAGGFVEIFIDPKIDDSSRVLDILAHELIHAVLGCGKGHGKEFKKIAEKIGLLPPMKATTASPLLKEKLDGIVKEIGEYPHKKWESFKFGRSVPDDEKSKTYICKARCYELSVKNKYAEKQTPICPICGKEMRGKTKKDKNGQLDISDFS